MHDDRETALETSRREVLALLAAAGGMMVAGRSSGQAGSASPTDGELPPCIVTPEQTEGPYFVDERLNRSDIRIDPADGAVESWYAVTTSASRLFSQECWLHASRGGYRGYLAL